MLRRDRPIPITVEDVILHTKESLFMITQHAPVTMTASCSPT
jgi:hypothetical protein